MKEDWGNKTIADNFNSSKAVNWNAPEDGYTQDFWDQNVAQFWLDKDFPVSDDILDWVMLSSDERECFSRVLVGLTSLDTKQSSTGMPFISVLTEGEQRKAVLNFMGAMEGVHAKSYSSIFTTLMSQEEINSLFDWCDTQPNLLYKTKLINKYYITPLLESMLGASYTRSYYMALVASVFLESFLFYSGFFYPLYLAGRGKMTSSGEVIGLIIRDESLHGVLVGLYAQEAFEKIPEDERESVSREVINLLEKLYQNEVEYTQKVYSKVGLVDEVVTFLKYNADKALMNLGMPAHFGVEDKDVNPIVFNGINTATVNHDFFSGRGNGYVHALNVQKVEDDDFLFDITNPFGDTDLD